MRDYENKIISGGQTLKVEGLSVWLRQKGQEFPMVRSLSFEVAQGGCTGIIGESGCGKSLSCQAVMGLLEPPKWRVEGNVFLEGEPVPVWDDCSMEDYRGSAMAMILQDPLSAFDPRMTVGAHFCEGIPFWDRRRKRECLAEAAEKLRLMKMEQPEDILAGYPYELSGGMLQRVLIAVAMSGHPKLLIADEPTTALDAAACHEVLELLLEVKRKEDISLLLVSHDLEVILAMADRIVVIYGGEAVEWGTAEEIRKRPLHPYTRGLFCSRPSFSKKRLQCMEGSPPRMGQIPENGCAFAARCTEGGANGCRYKEGEPGTARQRNGRAEVFPGHFVRCRLMEEDHGSFIRSERYL